ncbi:family 78 glycoside hydrolase catalytic domain [Paenibacillus chungangensis]|uniref:alpha-L-rhamnosidase n=1 Tax=Paenibacillus chungangensis TaxID=696535 RepID=A0ABW3HQD2_9BACL
MLSVYDLTCEYRRNPIAIEQQQPRLSWKLRADTRGVMQSAYRIQVAQDPEFSKLVWDTGRVDSDSSVLVEYGGKPLHSRSRYFYRIQAWDAGGQSSDWSELAFWETALRHDEWQAAWISSSCRQAEEAEACDYMRHEFTIGQDVVSARLYVTAQGLYRIYVNGLTPDDSLLAPGWTSYHHRLQYQAYDVTGLLASGANALGAMVGNGWYKGNLAWEGKRNFYGDERALLLQLHIVYADGSEEVVCSDDTWQCSNGALQRSELYHGELYDARLEETGWSEPDFRGEQWQAVRIIDREYEGLVAQESDPMRIVQELQPLQLLTSPRGETIVDMGQNMVGWIRFTAQQEAGAIIELQHAEVLDRDGNFYTGNLRTASQTVTYICKGGGEETYEPFFSFQGFRYVKVTGMPAEELLERMTGCVVHTDMEPTGSFQCSDHMLNQLQRNIVWGQKGNFVDVPTDCPQRDERLGWTGDAQVFIRTAAFQFNVAPFFTKWLKDVGADQQSDGAVPHVVPDIPGVGYGSSAWGDAAVICPWTIYECYGDRRILESQYNSMRAWVDYIRAQGEQEYLWNTGFHFGDWLALDGKADSSFGATPNDLIATAFYAYSADLLAKTAEVLGKSDDAEAYRELNGRVVHAFRAEFVTPSGRVASQTQTAYVLALMFDLLEERDRPRTAAMLAEHVRASGTHLTTGFVGTPYLCLVLSRFGYTELAYELVLQKEYPSWLYSVSKGATTIWEHWDSIKPDGSFWSDEMNSFNHYAYGSVGEWLYRIAAGINLKQPGYKSIQLQPHISGQLSYVKAELKSMYGDIVSGWRRDDDGAIQLEVTVPANTTAEVVVPAGRRDITEHGTGIDGIEGVLEVSEDAKRVTRLKLGSGTYCLKLSASREHCDEAMPEAAIRMP